MPVALKGSSSGDITLTAPAVAGTTTITLPATTGNAVVDVATQTLTNKTLTSPVINTPTMGGTVITSDTAKASTSGTSVDFTGIPSWAKRVTLMFNGVSTSGTSSLLIQLGTSGGIVSSGYVSTGVKLDGGPSRSASTAGFLVIAAAAQLSTDAFHGQADFCLLGSNTWTGNGIFRNTTSSLAVFGGSSGDLGGVLTQIRVTTAGGTDTFDTGTINIMYQ